MATIDSLPPEILIEIMKECDLHDVAALMKSSPLFLHLFSVHREHLLTSVVDVLRPDYPDCEPHLSLCMSTLASRIRCQKRLDATTEEAEAVNDHLWDHRDLELDLSTSTYPPILRNISRLHTEAKFVAGYYACACWRSLYRHYKLKFPAFTPATWPKTLWLSQTERWRFVQTAIHYDAFCQMFFLNGEVLFEGYKSKRERFFQVSEMDGIGAGNIYSIAGFIVKEYDTMVSHVAWTLDKWEKWEDSIKERQTDKPRVNLKVILRQGKKKVFTSIRSTMQCNRVGNTPDRHHADPSPEIEANLQLWQKYTSRFKQRTTKERQTFIHFLTSQGLGMFCKLVQMNSERRIEFLLEMFYRLNKGNKVTADHPSFRRSDVYWEPWMGTVSRPVLRNTFAFEHALECWDMARFPRKDGQLLDRAETSPTNQVR
ncbi:uncharacterized protein B0J16DRAFT_322500 [Fusarium flagelliforme]|uniref:Uncharacterized protein n=1 Tax=Fusarium flagelliforme TaxID=2675880 RepID=A0A395MKN8_9HYPO|nr:uncharacterized protein B0J16DRAFT_322500 [Fusarium flagelliforme]KAH7179011.1 hypothetical protein B0J16DRAFT_322500 [Fusarium flagelliforme]RFN48498.1 hypothetical protein FIE12Z_7244 [Fusarium flagelliforme]